MNARQWQRTGALAGVLCAGGLIGGRALAQDNVTPAPPEPKAPVAPVVLSVTTDKKLYHAGEPIKMTLTVKNATASEANLMFATTQKYDFAIRRGKKPDAPVLWQWSKGTMFGQILMTRSLPAGKTLTFTETLDPVAKHVPLTPGDYTLRATLATFGPPASRPAATVPFRIR